MEKNVTKFYVTNWEGRVGSDPNMYDVTLLDLFFLNSSLRNFPSFKGGEGGLEPQKILSFLLPTFEGGRDFFLKTSLIQRFIKQVIFKCQMFLLRDF